MKYLIETDLGHDPDDLFCICHLAEMGLPIKAIGLVPGSPEQIALACGLRKHLGLDFEIGVAKQNTKPEHLGIHKELCERHNWKQGVPDGDSPTVFKKALNEPVQLLIIGPAPGLGAVAADCKGIMTFQGGFLPYSIHSPVNPLPQFEGKGWMPTFNFNGCRPAVDALLNAPLTVRRFCGKNICHGIKLTKEHQFAPARSIAGEVYLEAVRLYFERHEEKKMHDPTALVCHLHPEIATWFRGTPTKAKDGWTTVAGDDYVLADVDHEQLWIHILARD